jgi:O-acetyl-ADP-ribose deacetylase (regulator of RNase III)
VDNAVTINVIFRDRNPAVVSAIRAAAPMWDVECENIFYAGPADYIVSPANCIGRMDGGIDAVYVQRFGWQLQARLSHHLIEHHGGRDEIGRYNGSAGRVEIGCAITVSTGCAHIPLMIMAPTMDWPPGPVPDTENAYLAFRAALRAAIGHWGVRSREPRVLTPGLCTLTGRMAPERCAEQMVRAWKETCQ